MSLVRKQVSSTPSPSFAGLGTLTTLIALVLLPAVNASTSSGVSGLFALDLRKTGPLSITDDVGGATIEIGGEALPGNSPIDLADLPFGQYVVTAYKEDVLFEEGSITVNLDSKAGAQVHFTLSNVQFSEAYRSWLDSNFTLKERSDWQIVGAASDPDGDLAPNELEFVALLNPNDAASRFVVESRSTPSLNFQFSPFNDGVNFRLESSDNLAEWDPVPESQYRLDGDRLIIDQPEITNRRFYRVVLLGDGGDAEFLPASE